MQKSFKLLIISTITSSLLACSGIQTSEAPAESNLVNTDREVASIYQPIKQQASYLSDNNEELTLQKIMADPDWIGRQPQSPYWSLDGNSYFYSQKREGSVVKDLFQQPVSSKTANLVPIANYHQVSYKNKVFNQSRNKVAWVFKQNVFMQDLNSGEISQLTRSDQYLTNLQFLKDGRLSYRVYNKIYAIDVASGITEQLVSWEFKEAPQANEPAKDYIAQQQLNLIEVLRDRRQRTQDKFEFNAQISEQNQSTNPEPFYFPVDNKTADASLSPNGRYLILAIEKDTPSRDEGDIMPNYIKEDGRIKAEKVRHRVADAKPKSQYLWLLDLQTGTQKELSYKSLPGYNEDVLEQVKRENAEAKGLTYQSNRLPRDIGLLVDWGWNQSAIAWQADGENVAIMLEAWDNKDRWLTTVDFAKQTLVTQDRLHDDAWINYNFNSFGWLNHSSKLYFLSEKSGYAHLYLKDLNSNAKQLTSGEYEVDELTLTANDQYIYFKANKKHPGIYEIYRVDLNSGDIEELTNLNGVTDYLLNDAQNKLLLTHSKLTMPPELFVKILGSEEPAQQVTFTTSEAFKQINWTIPEIVPIKSSHVEQSIYARLYAPKDAGEGEKKRAVIFNHGAGYLQNSHLGWSTYFREFMFHNLLVQKGYVVLDMDYRASAGYGRDWRTAIYRHMGKPEIEDLVDGVDWMVNNVNVDRNRIGTYGGSYGGFMTFMALFTEPDLFQAGAALRPVSDWAHYNHPYTSNILNTPDVDPIAYERSSPIYFAEGLTKPLLINAPMVDSNVFFVDTVRLVQRLIELEKQNFETAIYPVESHGFIEPSSWLDEYRRIFKLFEENL
ncbi:prolyl oligopeptidase family serine peptidase [Aliiglaciecola sp. 2_MG-2023]|uniref:S9 family peptidase n=1 Tax=unclassified Aliiglaciecola TaxID=2593648 RepID=UPI0026E2B36D|nr:MULTISPECIES: prolyl oligopeptidase family serine peptidase [unclassified Aliiglaciecola]MDO6710446.1 prolyl oligopeptidase family serine peptidase [Aliiglaciecola sp. 2_MG-2023]MDO6751689.1 prolyl oligopeptidase family serine peptidase [Aliiglaciecola sp. 1_MG-2023]